MELTTEQLILEAAREVFIKRGYDGARMQEIADVAGINKALLHYYYRSKDKLFDAVFKKVLAEFLPSISNIISQEVPFVLKAEMIVDSYLKALRKNPYIPSFIIHELNVNPQKFVDKVTNFGINPRILADQLMGEKASGKTGEVDPIHTIVNIISLCIFPFVARPIIQRLFLMTDTEFEKFSNERKEQIMKTITKTLQP